MKYIVFTCLLVSQISFAQNKFRSHGENLRKGSFEFGSRGSFFKSTGIYDEDGEKKSYDTGESYSRADSSLYGIYSLTKNLQVQANTSFRINNSTEFDGVKNQTLSATGLHHIGGSFNLMFRPTDNLIASVEGEYRKRMYTNPLYTGDKSAFIILGNQAAYIHAGANLSYVFNKNFVVGMKGLFRNIGTNISNDFLADIVLALERESLTFYLGTKRSLSLKSEKYRTSSDKPNIGNGATSLYNGLNQEFGSIYAGLEFYFKKKWTVGLGIESVYYAKSYDTGNAFIGELKYTIGSKTVNHHEHTFKTYSIEANVIESLKDNSQVMVDAGRARGVRVGMRFDFYHGNLSGDQRLVATGYVSKVYTDQSVVTIKRYFRKEKLDGSTFARADN
jgi:hypothetical protein